MWSIVSKALDKSINTPRLCSCLSKDDITYEVYSVIAFLLNGWGYDHIGWSIIYSEN